MSKLVVSFLFFPRQEGFLVDGFVLGDFLVVT